MVSEYADEADITLLDRTTGESRTVHWGPGHSHEFWWQSGNGHCDCNRGNYFHGELSCENRCGHSRYIITHVDGSAVNFEEWNHGYEPLKPSHPTNALDELPLLDDAPKDATERDDAAEE